MVGVAAADAVRAIQCGRAEPSIYRTVRSWLTEYRRLGRTGIKVNEVRFGGWPIGDGWGGRDDAQALKAPRRAFDLGCPPSMTPHLALETARSSWERRCAMCGITLSLRRRSPRRQDAGRRFPQSPCKRFSRRTGSLSVRSRASATWAPTTSTCSNSARGRLHGLSSSSGTRHSCDSRSRAGSGPSESRPTTGIRRPGRANRVWPCRCRPGHLQHLRAATCGEAASFSARSRCRDYRPRPI